jgi:hypothetical protein
MASTDIAFVKSDLLNLDTNKRSLMMNKYHGEIRRTVVTLDPTEMGKDSLAENDTVLLTKVRHSTVLSSVILRRRDMAHTPKAVSFSLTVMGISPTDRISPVPIYYVDPAGGTALNEAALYTISCIANANSGSDPLVKPAKIPLLATAQSIDLYNGPGAIATTGKSSVVSFCGNNNNTNGEATVKASLYYPHSSSDTIGFILEKALGNMVNPADGTLTGVAAYSYDKYLRGRGEWYLALVAGTAITNAELLANQFEVIIESVDSGISESNYGTNYQTRIV